MQISYRAIYNPSSLVRRLRYVSQLLNFVAQKAQNQDIIVDKLRKWSISHTDDFTNYQYSTGAAHSSKKIGMTQLAENYLTLSVKFGLLSEISNIFYLSRMGRVLYILQTDKPNEDENLFILNKDERLFYIFQMLQQDADNLLTVLNLVNLQENTDLNFLKNNFYESFVKRLKMKIATCSKEHIINQLHDRYIKVTEEWKKPESYASYFLPPRLNWLLDLRLLDLYRESNKNIYQLTESGQKLVRILPTLTNSNIPDVTDTWFNTSYFSEITPLMISSIGCRYWREVDENTRIAACKEYIQSAFEVFRKSNLPTISLRQGLLFLCLRFGTELKLITNVSDLIQWFQEPQLLDNYIYELRISARDNESYIVRRHA